MCQYTTLQVYALIYYSTSLCANTLQVYVTADGKSENGSLMYLFCATNIYVTPVHVLYIVHEFFYWE